MNNIVFFGATGFLGMHLLYNLLESNSKDYVYCVVREENVESAKERLLEIFHFYFNDDYEEAVNSRVKFVLGDLCEDNFGMSDEDYFNLGSMTSKVIHCGAIVKHFGKKEEFYKVNVQGTSKVAEFCQRFDAYMLFVSSIAVIEKMTTDGNWKYRADNLSDEYVKSKIKAEEVIMKYNQKGLRSSIIRVGSLAGRYADGVFQKNIEDNALYARLKTILQSGYLPASLLEKEIEFLPIDECAKALNHILADEKEGIYLFYNYNTVTY
ncbi:MAG: SDR family oxidoreductase, partial [Ruminiclostridium sp.]